MTVLIAGGGIAGLALGLTCHQLGIAFRVFESADTMQPLGVGIHLQPAAVRELFDLGLKDQLAGIAVKTRDYGLYSKKGLHVWTEPRGTWAGYRWPQYSVHRGQLHMLLYNSLVERAGVECVETGWFATGFDNVSDKALLFLQTRDGQTRTETGDIVIGADGIHSAVRARMEPDEGEPVWNGTVLWRGTTRAMPFLSGASMVTIGHDGLRFVACPISEPDPQTGEATISWTASLNFDTREPWKKEDWTRSANVEDFLPHFVDFEFDWLNVPMTIRDADVIYEYPMVDRDPIERWTHGRVSLMGDAAHVAYPVGVNGAGSAIIDARTLGAGFLAHGLTPEALQACESEMLSVTSKVTLINRVAGPDSILDTVEERCGGQFDSIEDVIPHEELAEHARKYKAISGCGIEETNTKPRTIAASARWG